jgi:SAM-dependent methyltransferase
MKKIKIPVPSKWNPEIELEHIESVFLKNLDNEALTKASMSTLLYQKWQDFRVEYWLEEKVGWGILGGFPYTNTKIVPTRIYGKDSLNVCDIGGGPMGGSLAPVQKYFSNALNNFTLVDPLIDKFDNCFTLPKFVQEVNAFSDDIPLLSEAYDLIFCWEALDHCDNLTKFIFSIKEIIRLLRKDGVLFFEMPLRENQIDGHPIYKGIISQREIVDMFKMAGLTILSEKESPRNYNSPNGFMLIGQKKKS